MARESSLGSEKKERSHAWASTMEMIEIKRIYHIKFFIIFLSLLGFKDSTYQIVLQGI